MPAKYAVLANAADHIDDLEHKRLTDSERKALDEELVDFLLQEFSENGKRDRFIKEQIENAKPIAVARIQTRQNHYHVVQFSNRIELHCEPKIFQSSPIKKYINRLY